jgi:hypothetical protein
MRLISNLFSCLFLLFFSVGCGSNANKKAVNAADLDSIMAEEARNAPAGPSRSKLTVDELVSLSDCNDAACVQLFMKDLATDFVHAKKGELASLNRSVILDKLGREKIMPLSTLYFTTDPGADWRIAHTIHKQEISDQLLSEFAKKGFTIQDSGYYYATKSFAYHYTSTQYPGKVLYFSSTYTPWGSKGMYLGANWLSFVFEIVNTRL